MSAPKRIPLVAALSLLAFATLATRPVDVPAQVVARVNIATDSTETNSTTFGPAAVGDAGRFIAFTSLADNLIAGDTNGAFDVFVYDRFDGSCERVSVGPGGRQGTLASGWQSGSQFSDLEMSGDGRYVVFWSAADSLIATPMSLPGVYVRDRAAGTTRLASLNYLDQPLQTANAVSISDDGRYVVFDANDLFVVLADSNGVADVFVRDMVANTTSIVSVDDNGNEGNLLSSFAMISGNGRYVVFESFATTFDARDANASQSDVFIRDLVAGTTELVSMSSDEVGGDQASGNPYVSFDGRWVVFSSGATNLVTGDTNARVDVFVRDRMLGETYRASVGSGSIQNGFGSDWGSISDDGRIVTFETAAKLSAGDTNNFTDIYFRDPARDETVVASITSGGVVGNQHSNDARVSGGGGFVVFESGANNLVAGDGNGLDDLFLSTYTTFGMVVNSVGDLPDENPGDGVCTTGRTITRGGDSEPECTCRAAIEETNALAGADTVRTDIPGPGPHVVTPGTPLPDVTDVLVFIGQTSPGPVLLSGARAQAEPLMWISGDKAGAGANGFVFTTGSAGSRLIAHVIGRFDGSGVHILANDVSIEESYVGITADGATDWGNTGSGVYIDAFVAKVRTSVLSNNGRYGIEITGISGSGHEVTGCVIGLAPGAVAFAPNAMGGVFAGGGGRSTIGGDASAPGTDPGNVIAGNDSAGIFLASDQNEVRGNVIGLAVGGTIAANAGPGVVITGIGNVVGGDVPARRNVISGNDGPGLHIAAGVNQVFGNYIGTDPAGGSAAPNRGDGVFVAGVDFNEVGDTQPARGNVISGNDGSGVRIEQSGETAVAGNRIGTNAAGDAAVPNGECGAVVSFQSTKTNITGNTISGNTANGILLSDRVEASTIDNNIIGLDAAGAAALGNGIDGIVVEESRANVIDGNTISGNIANGVSIVGILSDSVVVVNNSVGVSSDRSTPIGNGGHGIYVGSGATRTRIGAPGTSQVIGGNLAHGIMIDGSQGGVPSGDTRVLGNWIGIGPGNTNLGNYGDGIHLLMSPLNEIGDGTAAGRNVISGNGAHGVVLEGSGSGPPEDEFNRLTGNYIGTGTAGQTAVSNILDGVSIQASSRNVIGEGGAGNVISGNFESGVVIAFESAGNRVGGNLIGLAADGVTALGNDGFGVAIGGGANNSTIGGAIGNGDGNVISANETGILIVGAGSNGNSIVGNLIGTDAQGLLDRGNASFGVNIGGGASNNITGGADPSGALRNVISGNHCGIVVSGNGSVNNHIWGNYIGVDVTGQAALGNEVTGVVLSRSFGIRVGGVTPGAGNVISGNGEDGVTVWGSAGTPAIGNTIRGNFIGTNDGGTAPIANQRDGINLLRAQDTDVGGGTIAAGNVISGNNRAAVLMEECIRTRVLSNAIGTDITRQNLIPNVTGISLIATRHAVIGEGAGTGNVIAGGVLGIVLGNSVENDILANTITQNGTGLELTAASSLNRIIGNTISLNTTAYTEDGTNTGNSNIIANNLVTNNNGTTTGLRISDGSPIITGNSLDNDAGDAIKLSNGAAPIINANNIFSNTGMGVNNTDAAVTVDATSNWWGDSSGPSGAGTGTGDAVSSDVDFSGWLTAPVSVVVTAFADTLYLAPGLDDTVTTYFRNWQNPTDNVDITVGDTQGWVTTAAGLNQTLDDAAGNEVHVGMATPGSAAGGEMSVVTVTVTSTSQPSQSGSDQFAVLAYVPVLTSMVVAPDTISVAPGDSLQFEATGFDQFLHPIALVPTWSADGGTIDAQGLYVAGTTPGIWTVTATGTGGVSASATVEITDTAPLELALGVLQNPHLTQFVDIFVVAPRPLSAPTVALTVNSSTVPMTLNDPAENVWRADYELGGAGTLQIDVCADAAGGGSGCTSTSLRVAKAARGADARVTSADGVFSVRVDGEAVASGGFVLVIPGRAAQGARKASTNTIASYVISPPRLFDSEPMTVAFDYRRLAGAPVDAGRLSIVGPDGERTPTLVDPDAGVVRTTVIGAGRFDLVVGDPGTSRVVDSRRLALRQNYPNPFNPTTTIEFEVETRQDVRLSIYDVAGRLVSTLVDGGVPAGITRVVWDGHARNGNAVASGIYFVRIATRYATATRKMVLLK